MSSAGSSLKFTINRAPVLALWAAVVGELARRADALYEVFRPVVRPGIARLG